MTQVADTWKVGRWEWESGVMILGPGVLLKISGLRKILLCFFQERENTWIHFKILWHWLNTALEEAIITKCEHIQGIFLGFIRFEKTGLTLKYDGASKFCTDCWICCGFKWLIVRLVFFFSFFLILVVLGNLCWGGWPSLICSKQPSYFWKVEFKHFIWIILL